MSHASPPAVLAALLDRPDASGADLARQLGLSRAAVWKQIQTLRAAGLAVTAQAGIGYRLDAPLELLDAAAILDGLDAVQQARLGDLAVHWQLDSTNSALLRRAGEDRRDRLACLAELQTQGRGRRGRSWQTPLGGGLAVSLLKRFDGAMAGLAGLSAAVGVMVVRALADCGVDQARLKWPNDVTAGDRKLAGILIELGGDALGPCYAVIGIGINLRLDRAIAIDQPWIDLASLADDLPSRNRLAGRVLARLIEGLDVFAAHGLAAFAEDYARLDALRDRPVRAIGPAGERTGIARGLGADGSLRLDTGHGEVRVDSGEVSIRLGGP
ncbi:MAG TPA: biotin--[acetyl-CoA-carboxylase] ligase [Dokdonella sp.]|uniref:biotin--[acetyl-CoA-carboxylase] ligase n=1 Tax=Dokdonella sp. TaxID=2291710 RepID=UPI002CC30664|nr:biotin--[acetyl-CoA-carboxylase] ligase [Dokdonella sp.]HUD41870.1 biotin--[acetyl-CoA-carboxylase] ligase [Dokdonella sp.]